LIENQGSRTYFEQYCGHLPPGPDSETFQTTGFANELADTKATQQLPHWQAAAEALILAAEDRGPLLHARVGMLRAMNHGVERVFRSDRKETPWGKRKLKRDQ
jgi:hypothetical protein